MRRFLILAALVMAGTWAASGQTLVIGEKAPDISASQWAPSQPQLSGLARLVDFYHGLNGDCRAQLSRLSSLAAEHKGSLAVIVVSKEGPDDANSPGGPDKGYFTAYDTSGRTFAAYGVRYVPFSVLLDGRGRVVWFGNLSSLDGATIEKAKK